MTDILEGLLERPKQLKPLLDKHGEVCKEIRRDPRYSNEHKDELVADERKNFDDQLQTFILNFDQGISQKRVVLEARANPAVERNGDSEMMPDSMRNALQSEKAIWGSMAESKAIMSEILKNQQVALFRDDLELMDGPEIVKEYESEETDPLFRSAIETYGLRRLKRIARSGSGGTEPLQHLNRLITKRKEALKTPIQRQAEADMERLEALSSRFHSNLGLLEKLRGRK